MQIAESVRKAGDVPCDYGVSISRSPDSSLPRSEPPSYADGDTPNCFLNAVEKCA